MKTIFISGATSGIGLAAAAMLDKNGFRVIAGVLPGEDTSNLEKAASDNLVILPVDITKIEMVAEARRQIEQLTGDKGLYALVNNAGIGSGMPLEFHPMAEIRQIMEVNFFGHVQVTQEFLPLLRKAKGARIVNIASIAGIVASPMMGAYSASKHAVEAFSASLRQELAPHGIKVSIIEPGIIKTPIWDKALDTSDDMRSEMPPDAEKYYSEQMNAQRTSTEQLTQRGSSPDVVASAITDALTSQNPKAHYTIGHLSTLFKLMSLLPARLRDWMLARSLS